MMTKLQCYKIGKTSGAIPLLAILKKGFKDFEKTQAPFIQNWIKNNNFSAEAGQFCILPNEKGEVLRIVVGTNDLSDQYLFADLIYRLPAGDYYVENKVDSDILERILISWGMGAYQFTQYKAAKQSPARLVIPSACDKTKIQKIVESIYLARDLINTPAEDMHPEALAKVAMELAKEKNATCKVVVGKDLLKQNYPAIHTVGRASAHEPRLIDLQWGKKKDPLIILVGKGVCFDTGGLNIKQGSNMLLMKKDMGGAAHVLALAKMIMEFNLKVQLRVLIPAVENSVAGNAYRPGDVIKMRNGKTVEVGDTDAEGRLVLADALTLACEDKEKRPDLLVDFATLTGAARVALGTEVGMMFSTYDPLAQQISQKAISENDPLWQMPLYQNYRKGLQSKIADLKNVAGSAYGGAITAALFLQEFVPPSINWLHFDIMAWNISPRPGHPEGAELMGVRALFAYLCEHYG
jgi:leucyl aminopeptidase